MLGNQDLITGSGMFKKILIPTDGSQLSAKATKAGIELARALDAKVVVYYALAPVPVEFSEAPTLSPQAYRQAEIVAQQTGQNYVDKIEKIARAAGVSVASVVTKVASPHTGIIDVAKKQKCDVIVMASHGRSGLSKLLVGSVTQKVVALAHIPVIVFR
jgi:nucleotide-binding universal stress UspA family protein